MRTIASLSVLVLLTATASAAPRSGTADVPRDTKAAPSTPSTPSAPPTLGRDAKPGEKPSVSANPPGEKPGKGVPQSSSNPARQTTTSPSTTPPSSPSSNPAEGDMRFEIVREGPAEKCGDKCRVWVSASGRITPETAKEFEAFSKDRDLRGKTVVLESIGGAVVAGLDLGRAFRQLDMTVTIGKTTFLSGEGDRRGTLSPKAVCASMCTFVLLGGARRHVPAEAKVLVHQIWPSAKREDAASQSYSADNLVALQRNLGTLARYTIEMGGDIELFEIASRVAPWERMRAITNDELGKFKLRTSDNPFEGPVASTAPVTTPAPAPAPAATPPTSGMK